MPDRLVPFQRIHNFRDLGGYESTLGGTTRWGRVYRADALDQMSDDDRERFGQLGVQLVIDLRSDLERASRPDPVPSIHVSLVGAMSDPARESPFSGLDDGERILGEVYRGILAHAAPEFGQLLTAFTDTDGLPAVFHCTAGKDRTGLLAAVLLEALGVDRETVLDDFELTGKYVVHGPDSEAYRRVLEMGVAPEAAVGMLGVSRWTMAEALSTVDDAHGGIVEYLRGPGGMSDDVLTRLRQRLLV